QMVITQMLPHHSVSLGGTITISCRTTQSSYSIGWYQQKGGQGPRFVHCDEIPNRFTATRSGTTGTLTITNVEAEDEADYYCGRWNSAGNVLYSYGEGVLLQIKVLKMREALGNLPSEN
uniref:Ig-like domain-containing protein n=1 Tax=Naja naja TaxID=35670 RepID=A0A8C6VK68_NAJNA